MALSFTACPKQPTHKRFPTRERVPPKEVKEVSRPQQAASTPQRKASSRLVEKGMLFLDDADYERAASVFRDAVNVDTTNGIAYYYLAFAHARMEEPDVALGLLDKAEALLGYDEDWTKRIDELRGELGAEGPREVVPSPIDEAF